MRYYIDTEFRERPGTIELISIGIVAEDGRELYAENAFFNWHDVPTDDWLQENVRPHLTGDRTIPAVIRERVLQFAPPDKRPEFWGYFADYDWVVFAWLFGRMIDLPKGYPMWCRDVKQEMARLRLRKDDMPDFTYDGAAHNALADAHFHRHLHREVLRVESERRDQARGLTLSDVTPRARWA